MVPFLLFSMLGSAVPVENKEVRGRTLDSLEGKRVCAVLGESVKKGDDIRKIVKTSIELGYNACYVVKCALSGGGNLQQVIAGAVEAGATPDVVSKCAVDSGAETNEVARSLALAGGPSLCYFEPAGLGYRSPGDEMVPMDTTTPVRNTGARSVSPSAF